MGIGCRRLDMWMGTDMTTIDQMWQKFAEHQPFADELGYGEAWKRMCEERTKDASDAAADVAKAAADVAKAAANDAEAWAADAAAWAAEAAAWAADAAWAAADATWTDKAANAERWAESAISCIEKAEDLS